VTVTVTGQVTNGAGANQLVTGHPSAWPIDNASGLSATSPGILQVLCAADGSWSLPGLPDSTPCLITTPQGMSAGTTPAAGTYSLASLQSGSGWSTGGAS
jgi:hypothetical protein